jgi:hypothetical protein
MNAAVSPLTTLPCSLNFLVGHVAPRWLRKNNAGRGNPPALPSGPTGPHHRVAAAFRDGAIITTPSQSCEYPSQTYIHVGANRDADCSEKKTPPKRGLS